MCGNVAMCNFFRLSDHACWIQAAGIAKVGQTSEPAVTDVPDVWEVWIARYRRIATGESTGAVHSLQSFISATSSSSALFVADGKWGIFNLASSCHAA